MSSRKSIYRSILILLVFFDLMVVLDMGIKKVAACIPSKICVLVGKQEKFNFNLPVEGELKVNDVDVFHVDNISKPGENIHLNLAKPFSIKSTSVGAYKVDLKLFGKFSLKQIAIDVIDRVDVIPSGRPIGIYVNTDGVLVLGTGNVEGSDGIQHEPALNIVKSGDYIVGINGVKVRSIDDVITCVKKSSGNDLIVSVRRNGKMIKVRICPVKSAAGDYKIGLWIREDTQGLGTLTYTTTTGEYGALGHPITDADTGQILEIDSGTIYTTKILDIVKGKSGQPGEILGVINRSKDQILGKVYENTVQGIYGEMKSNFSFRDNQIMKVGLKQDIKLGKASILCTLDNKVKEYEISIERINYNPSAENKGMVIRITDEELLKKTNGIIQGMSGSPIIQNGRIIGAVTHVFVQDSTKGYGTFIENMLTHSQ